MKEHDFEGFWEEGSRPDDEEPRKFADFSDDELREMARKTDGGARTEWRDYDRAMLLAFFGNRYRDGVVPADLLA